MGKRLNLVKLNYVNNKKIIWTSSIQELNEINSLKIQPAKNFIPNWYQNTNIYNNKKLDIPNRIKTIKSCPSFYNIFNEGYVMVAPVDIYIKVFDEHYEWTIPNENIYLEDHAKDQFVELSKISNIKYISKLVSSWHCITPKGYSLRQIPMSYHNFKFSVPYGVVNTDYSHEINPQIMFNNNIKNIYIKQGQPLALYIPFKRNDKLKLKIENYNQHKNKIKKSKFLISGSTFKSNYLKYLK